jgi:hypothetical protein
MSSDEGYGTAENADTMVLRSFHLPQGMDDQLRGLAFALRCAKADLLRFFITEGMTRLKESYGPDWWAWSDDDLAEVAQAVQAGGASESVKDALLRDIARIAGEVLAHEPPPAVLPTQAT